MIKTVEPASITDHPLIVPQHSRWDARSKWESEVGRRKHMNRDVPWKDIILIVAIIYFISPIDLVPGVIVDDLAALGGALWPFVRRAIWL